MKNELEENPDRTLSLAEFTCFRDHLLFIIDFGIVYRSGVTANMTMGEFRRAREIADGVIAISVWDHKTSEHYGPDQVTFDKEEFSWIECFANVIRPKMPNLSTTNKVFLSWTGMNITSGYLSG